jgi:hypothetical protein
VSEYCYYIVDRPRGLSAGLVIDRVPLPDLGTTEETRLARCVFSDGITKWGEDKVLFTQPSLTVTIEALAGFGLAAPTPAG